MSCVTMWLTEILSGVAVGRAVPDGGIAPRCLRVVRLVSTRSCCSLPRDATNIVTVVSDCVLLQVVSDGQRRLVEALPRRASLRARLAGAVRLNAAGVVTLSGRVTASSEHHTYAAHNTTQMFCMLCDEVIKDAGMVHTREPESNRLPGTDYFTLAGGGFGAAAAAAAAAAVFFFCFFDCFEVGATAPLSSFTLLPSLPLVLFPAPPPPCIGASAVTGMQMVPSLPILPAATPTGPAASDDNRGVEGTGAHLSNMPTAARSSASAYNTSCLRTSEFTASAMLFVGSETSGTVGQLLLRENSRTMRWKHVSISSRTAAKSESFPRIPASSAAAAASFVACMAMHSIRYDVGLRVAAAAPAATVAVAVGAAATEGTLNLLFRHFFIARIVCRR